MKPTNFMNLFHGQVPPVREFNREMDLLTAFDYPYRLSTMGDYIRQMEITPEYGLEFLGIVELGDW